MDIKGKTAIVTGAASGLGMGTVKMLHGLGANVLACDLDAQNGEALASELGDNVMFANIDVTDSESVQVAVESAAKAFGAVHILVNCVGIYIGKQTLGRNGPHDLDIFRKIIDVNLISTFDVIRQTALQMQKNNLEDCNQERGVIVNVSSIAAFDGQKGFASYSASKAAIVGMTLPIACDLSPVGIRVCSIAPGMFDTPMNKQWTDEAKSAVISQFQYPKRFGLPEEFAMLVQHIIENPMLNGETIRLDAGFRARAI
jgi:3-hydroxyacyl-CoA dehydrogenase / 3-hydroxy-2-methylbutyryl-CoA dehydrogenase